MVEVSDAAVSAWTGLFRAQAAALGSVAARLRAAGLPPLEWYDVLLELEREGPMRPRDLQPRLLLAQYNLSRLLERLVRAGLVSREPCASDRRGQVVAITAQGRALRRRMWPVYAGAIKAAIGGRLSEGEARRLAALLRKLARPPRPQTKSARA